MYQLCADTKDAFCIHAIITAFQQHLDRNYSFNGEFHDFWELVLVTEGQIGVTAGQNIYSLKKGEAVLHEPMEFHRLWSEGGKGAGIIVITFRAPNFPTCETRLFQNINIAAATEVLFLLRQNYETHINRLGTVRKHCQTKAQIALKRLELFVLEILSQTGDVPNQSSLTAKNYANIVSVLENNLDKSLSVAQIASLCNMSEVNVKQTFSRYAGIGVIQYFNRLKVTSAISLLREGLSVQEVSNRFGFANQNYFSTVCKRITGNAPSFYK